MLCALSKLRDTRTFELSNNSRVLTKAMRRVIKVLDKEAADKRTSASASKDPILRGYREGYADGLEQAATKIHRILSSTELTELEAEVYPALMRDQEG